MVSFDYLYTFIIPHHNSPDLLDRCLSTIPSRKDIQIIVVDDNSEIDKRPSIERSDIQVIYVDKAHSKGAGHARNVGIEHSKGEWLLFVDCDDMLSDNAISYLDKESQSKHDIIFFSIAAVESDSLEPIDRCGVINGYITNFIKKRPCSEKTLRYNHLVPWGKMIRHSLISDNSILFDEVRYSNDIMFSARCGLAASTIGVNDGLLYIVTHREGSLVTQVSKASVYCRHEVLIRRIQLLVKNKQYLYINAPLSYIQYSKIHFDKPFVDELYNCAKEKGYTKVVLYFLQLLYAFGYIVRHISSKL